MIFRFPPEEQRAMLLAMEKCEKKEKKKAKLHHLLILTNSLNSSSSSKTVTFYNSGDWRNWMTLRDVSEVAAVDVFNIVEKIGVNPKGSKGGFFLQPLLMLRK
jgi:predicted secreted acid phosphatase